MPNTIVTRPPFRRRGQGWLPLSRNFNLLTVTGSGGVEIGGTAAFSFGHGAQVASDIVVEWDLDNDGDFDEAEEDITAYVVAIETSTGRDWPSLLTGKAGPGQLRATLNNSDDRFSYFNTASPLTTAPFSLKTGRKVRVRTTTATSPDPALLAKDRFGRADGALGTPEAGAAWSGPLSNDFVIVSEKAEPQTEGSVHIGVIDVGVADYYAQARFSEVGSSSNVVGLVYRYQDTTNYSLAVLDVAAAALKLINVVGGTPTTIATESVEVYDDITIGVLLDSTSVTLYHEGVPLTTATAVQTDETEVGIYASWATRDVRPEADDFYCWDGLPAEVEGILWTGDISDLNSTVKAGPKKFAVIEGRGWLDRLATRRIQPQRTPFGMKTGILVGNVLARTNLAHPPFMIDEGDVTTGPVGFGEMQAIEAARQFEEVEFGFLRETQEGYLAYDSRSARDSSTSQATFTDTPGGQFTYQGIEPLNWRREVFNRVIAGVAPSAPSGITITSYSGNAIANVTLTMPATINAGDLLLLNIHIDPFGSGAGTWTTPQGWTQRTGDLSNDIAFTSDNLNQVNRIYVKVAAGDEDGDSLTFATGFDGAFDSFAAQLYRVTDWFGSAENGLAFSDQNTPGNINLAGDDPPAAFPSWGPAPSLLIAWDAFHEVGSGVLTTGYPTGYAHGTHTGSGGAHESHLLTAYRFGAVEVENPGAFGTSYTDSYYEQSIAVAVRGANGSLNTGVVQVQVDDLDSQADHNSIRTFDQAPNFFADETDAETYAQLLLDRYAEDRPIIGLEFYATKSGAYRMQAIRRRVNDRITLVADNNAGLGISQDFYIENISHRWSDGNTAWLVTWQLSPV